MVVEMSQDLPNLAGAKDDNLLLSHPVAKIGQS